MSPARATEPTPCAACGEPIPVGARMARCAHWRCYSLAWQRGELWQLPTMEPRWPSGRKPGMSYALPPVPCRCGCGRLAPALGRQLYRRCYQRLYRAGGRAELDRRYPRRERT